MLDLVQKNIRHTFLRNELKVKDLQTNLDLSDTPEVIECFDISHLSGTSMVGSMVQFRNGVPDKKNYRRFKINTVAGIDDVASIGEIVKRRYQRLIEENTDLPDLIIIDGRKGQLSAALEVLGAVPHLAHELPDRLRPQQVRVHSPSRAPRGRRDGERRGNAADFAWCHPDEYVE